MTVVQTLFSFEGRIRRSTWWGYVILTLICSGFVAWIVAGFLVGGLGDGDLIDRVEDKVGWLVMIWPLMALHVKRGHDLGWTGWWALLSFVPLINLIYWAILGFQEQQPGAERYGPSPKAGPGARSAPV
ncbi:DUF805 domain-containing protein [Brevundimonas sp.]|uniref:DUF805 domain-containing protein n=1 Tax=Brevundimonas sp. TaxID=1871086 RepID=UPI002C7A8726|nr:DUF805 domain-containing protein [Brevundimonas sp.]HWQ85762.1 DUF805 domain-containing protein [Brevundimonas sp.]